MKVFAVIGITKSGKTTTIEKIISELRRRRYTVGSVKDIHFEKFAIDTEGTNTDRHKQAGSQLVTARGLSETDILFQSKLPLDTILGFYDHDYVILEGVDDYNVPKIVCAHDTDGVDKKLDPGVFALSGVLSNGMERYKGLPVFNPLNDIKAFVDYIEEKVFPRLPDLDPKCCSLCGMSCKELLHGILRGEKSREDCVLARGDIHLFIDGKEIPMVDFVKNVVRETVVGLVSTLDGYKKYGTIEIKIEGKG